MKLLFGMGVVIWIVFPEENTKIAKLSDGTEVDLGELARKAMSSI